MSAWDVIDRPERDQLGEAPFWDEASQSLFWVDIVGRRAQRLDPATGGIDRWRFDQVCSAIIPSVKGDAIVALRDGLHRLDLASGRTTPFARPDLDEGNRSNETRTDPQGRIWLGTMCNNIGPDGEALPLARSSGGVFCVEPDGRSRRMLGDIGITNILCWAPDGTRFYTADSLAGLVWVFDYDPEGPRLANRRLFIGHGPPGGPDGAAMDEEGCLWGARWGGSQVIRFTPDGRIDRVVELPVAQPSCCAFGGPDRRTLYVTSARQELTGLAPDSLDGALFALRVDVAGLPLRRFEG